MNILWNRRHIMRAGLYAAGLITLGPVRSWSQPKPNSSSTQDTGGKQNLSQAQEKIILALQHEHGAIIQYINHCGKLKARGLMDQAMIIQAIIHDEISHAQDMIHILADAGVEPTLAVWPPKTGQKVSIMLKQDIAAEQGAIDLYTEILKADLPADAWEKVHRALEQEMKHKDLFDNLIEQIRQP
jgi:bacterioferritin (cytochrome b1)